MPLGFDELSMTSGQLPVVKNILRTSSPRRRCRWLNSAMELTTAEEIEHYIRTEMERRFISAESWGLGRRVPLTPRSGQLIGRPRGG